MSKSENTGLFGQALLYKVVQFYQTIRSLSVKSSELPKVRDLVDLRISSGEYTSIYTVRVEDITEDGIFIDRPIIDRRIFDIVKGQEVGIEYRRENVRYRFFPRVLGEGRLGSLPVIQIEHPKTIDRIRRKLRRENLRLNIPSRIVFHQKTTLNRKHGRFKRGTLIDVSAGGVKFSVPRKDALGIFPGNDLFLTFSLSGEISIIELESRVLKVQVPPHDNEKIEIICRYINISTKLRESIVVHNVRNQVRYNIEK